MVAQGKRRPGRTTRPTAAYVSTLLALVFILGACGRGGEESKNAAGAPPPEDLPGLLAAVGRAYGGPGVLDTVTGYRAEAVLSEAKDRRTGEMVLWFQRPDRLRLEYRYPEGGHVQILNRNRAWLGPDDLSLEAADSTFITSMGWEARCRGLPWSLLEDEERLTLLEPDEKGRVVVRTGLENGRVLDHHIDPESHRVVRLTLRDASDAALYELKLSGFRWVDGFLVPFRATLSDRGNRAVEIRFRDVKIDPGFPDPLFEPGS